MVTTTFNLILKRFFMTGPSGKPREENESVSLTLLSIDNGIDNRLSQLKKFNCVTMYFKNYIDDDA